MKTLQILVGIVAAILIHMAVHQLGNEVALAARAKQPRPVQLDPVLMEKASGPRAIAEATAGVTDDFIITFIKGENPLSCVEQIEAIGGEVSYQGNDRVRIKIHRAQISMIAGLNCIYHIEEYYPMKPANDNSTWIVQTYDTGNRRLFANDVTGAGQVIAIADTGVDTDHYLFWDGVQGLPDHTYDAAQRKILTYYNWYQDGSYGYFPASGDPMYDIYDWDRNGLNHGTHVAGTAAGEWPTGTALPTQGFTATAGYDQDEGTAYGAKLVFQDLARQASDQLYLPPDLNDLNPADGTYPGSVGLFPQAMADGAYIHLNPWTSAGDAGAYTAYCQDVDEMMWANRDFLVIYPIGDQGPGTTTITPPGTAKNCLTIGAAETSNNGFGHNSKNVAGFSSWGPAGGWGRIKPDVVAPGYTTYSALNNDITDGTLPNDGLVGMQGTSIAAGVAAGCCALVRQYFTGGFYSAVGASTGFMGAGAFTPSAAMMKATVIQSAEPMWGANTGGSIPGDGQGWGRVLLDNALYFPGDTRSLLVDDNRTGLDGAAIVQPFFKAYTVSVCPGEPLDVTVAYTDPPGTPGSAHQMVNFLYVEVDHPNGIDYYLSGADNFSNGQSVKNPPQIYPDTVQKVRINDPDPGVYNVFVVAFQTDQVTPGWNVQPYALTVCGNLAQSQGYVGFDKQCYQVGDTLHITAMDSDLAGNGTQTVTVTSAGVLDSETVTLTEIGGSGVFQGTIATAAGTVILGDGTLQVQDPDTLTVTYNDASPSGTRQDTAQIPCVDFGDAPDPDFPTLFGNNGARHVLGSGVYLGGCVDAEINGQPFVGALEDDVSPGYEVFGACTGNDDEDGVAFTTPLRAGANAGIDVTASAPCTLSAWLDFNADGAWDDPDEELFPGGQGLVAGVNSLTFYVPPAAVLGDTYARFRCTTDGAVAYTGQASDGEVEDYLVTVEANNPPVAHNDSYSTNEDTTLTVGAPGVLANDTDADGNPLTAVKVSDPANGSVTLNVDGSFVYTPNHDFNGTDSFTYQANDGWADSNVATVTISVIAQPDTFTLNKAGTGSGTVTSSPAGIDCGTDCNHTYPDGTNVTLTAAASTGSYFSGWSGDASGTDPSVDVTVTSDTTVTAEFTLKTHAVTFTEGEHGSISGTTTQTVDYGGTCTVIQAIPDTGYYFAGWTGDYTGAENPLTLADVTSDMNITAIFKIETCTIAASGIPSESGGTGTFTFTRLGDIGNLTVNFEVGGTATFGPAGDYTVTGAASFDGATGSAVIPDGYSTVDITVDPIDESVYDPAETVELTMTAAEGYTVGTPASAILTIQDMVDLTETYPYEGAGIADTHRVPSDTSIKIRIKDRDGVEPGSIELTVEGVVYTYGGGRFRVKDVVSGDKRDIWVVYDPQAGEFAFDQIVEVAITASDTGGIAIDPPYAYSFKIESQTQHEWAVENTPYTDCSDDPVTGKSTISSCPGSEVNEAKIICDTNSCVTPRFGPQGELPPLDVAGGVGPALNLEPATVFDSPVTVFIPVCSPLFQLSMLDVYRYSPCTGWHLAVEGDGWLVAGSRVNHDETSPPCIEIQVNHFSGAQAAIRTGGGGGGACFIAAAAYGSPMERHVTILRELRDRFLLTNRAGRTLVGAYQSLSPPVADCIARHEALREFVRWGLLPVIGMSWVALKLGPLSTMALVIFFLMGLIGIVRLTTVMR